MPQAEIASRSVLPDREVERIYQTKKQGEYHQVVSMRGPVETLKQNRSRGKHLDS